MGRAENRRGVPEPIDFNHERLSPRRPRQQSPKGRPSRLYVTGVDNADLFTVCHTLSDVGCGFYPNSKFVHVDVRPYGSHRVAWVDISTPGAPPEYVTSWPGILADPQKLSTFGSE